ncbi:MAG: hypothetical protein K8R74_18175 [Bacteroidales bacterium]|nr:hypothetical protein [Bacteroidales bacterium]
MNWYIGLTYFSLAICLWSCLYHLIRLVSLGKPTDYSQKKGNIGAATRYSFTGAMSPVKKESAYLHLPTYTAGLLYHIGTFLSIFLFCLFLFKIVPQGWLQWGIIGFLMLTGLSGLGILIKRMIKKELKALSNPDDFISNILVTAFQFITALVLYNGQYFPVYFIIVSALLLYLPLGKLKHTIYFFAARYHLGFFYGWRGVWPPK